MKKYVTNGARIKQLRERLDRGGKQAAFAAAVGISERLLRDVENKDAPLPLDKIDLIARKLGVNRYEVMVPDFDSVPVLPEQQSGAVVGPLTEDPPPKRLRGKQLYPRFDEISLSVTDAQGLFDIAKGSSRLITHLQISLTSETEEYASEVIFLLKGLTWDHRGVSEIDGEKAIAIQRRLRELVVLLKGNDVLVYAAWELKRIPESFELVAPEDRRFESETVIAFAPPGDYDNLYVRYDHGQPYEIDHEAM